MISQDLIFTDDIEIGATDLVVGDSDDQHVEHILHANPGQFYQYPDIGYGVYSRLNGSINVQTEQKLIKQAIENDNYSMPISGIIIDPAKGIFNVQGYVKKQ